MCLLRSGFSSDNQQQLSFSSAVFSHSRDSSRDDNIGSRQGLGHHSRENSGLVSDSETPQYARSVQHVLCMYYVICTMGECFLSVT